MIAAFQSKKHNDDIAESDGNKYDTVSSEELFVDLKDEMDNIERSPRSICQLEALRLFCTYIANCCEGF